MFVRNQEDFVVRCFSAVPKELVFHTIKEEPKNSGCLGEEVKGGRELNTSVTRLSAPVLCSCNSRLTCWSFSGAGIVTWAVGQHLEVLHSRHKGAGHSADMTEQGSLDVDASSAYEQHLPLMETAACSLTQAEDPH